MYRVLLAIFLTSISFEIHAQCTHPPSYTLSNITSSSVDIDLTGSGSGPWEFQYGSVGFNLGQGTFFQTNNNSTGIAGLNASQYYQVYVRRLCGASSSPWIGFSFRTSCTTVLSAPVSFDFDGPEWDTPGNQYAIGTMDSCWNISPQATNTFWSVGPPHKTRLTTGPESDHTTGFGQYILLNGSGISLDSGSTISMPAIDLQALNNPQFKFWYHLYGDEIDSLEVMAKISSSAAWDTLHTFIGQQQISQTENWQSITLPLNAYLNGTVDIQFVGYGSGTKVQMALDDISIHDSLACQPATYFRSVSNNHNSVLLDWESEPASIYKIEYGKKGFMPGTGTKVTTGQHPVRISNLSSDTTYVFYLRNDCDSARFSSWTGPLEVNTDCPPLIAPYFEDFEGGAWPLGGLKHCWDRFNYLDFKWNVGPPALSWSQSGPGANNHTIGGSKFIVADRPNLKGNARSSIISPLIKLDSIVNPDLVFWTHMFGLQITAFELSIDSGNGFELLKTIIGTQQISKTEDWTEQIIALPGYGGKTVKVKFTGIASSNWSALSRIAVDDLSIIEAPSCRKPTELLLANSGYTTANINWLSGGAANWLIRLMPTGGSNSIFPSAVNPMNLVQLQPGTEYTLWVRDSCGVGDVSEWSAPIVFKTYCEPDTTPYFQNFDSTEFVVRNSWFTTGSLAPCWERSHEIGPVWTPSPASVFANNLLPGSDHTTGSGQYIGGSLYLANGTNEFTSFTSPHIDLSNLSIPYVSFWYFLGGYTWSTNQLILEINNGSGWQQLTTIYGPVQLSTGDAWLKDSVDLSNYVNDTIRLRFKSLGSNLYASTAAGIDDISIYSLPCPPPTNLVVNNTNSTKAWLSWTSGGASAWVVKYRPVGGIFQYLTTAINDSFSLTGLTPNTRYEIWVRDSCGGEVSLWHGPVYFQTDCLPILVPYYEGFEDPSWVPSAGFTDPGIINSCWRRPDSINNVWVPKSGGSLSSLSGPSGPRTGIGNYMMLTILNSSSGSNPNEGSMKSPALINYGLQQPELNYWYHMYGSQINKLRVFVEKTNGSRVLIDSLVGQQQTSQTAAWQQRTVPLSGFQGDTIKIVFSGSIGNSLASVNAAIDDVEILDGICSGPSNLSATNITLNSAELNWTSVSPHTNIEYGLAGFTVGTGTVIYGVSPVYNLVGLQPFTTYDYYVQDSCRTSNSAWAGPYSFTTSCTAPIADFNHQGPALNVSFNGSNSTGTALSYSWDFGDGNTGSGLNPSNTYSAAGMYSVSLITTDTCGLIDTIIKNVQVCDLPQAVIKHSRVGLTVSFDGLSSIRASQYFWNLGPGGVSNNATPTAVFPAKGTYPIYLVVTNACGGMDTSFFDLVICDKPRSSFTATISTIVSPGMLVYFDGTASVDADSFLWIFGDGGTDSTSLRPVHVYATTSLNYVVTLITNADCGLSDTLSYRLSSISLKENSAPKMAVYPNPANERVTVTTTDNNLFDTDLLWFDVWGKLLHVPLISENGASLEFDVSGLAAGEYFLVNLSPEGGAIKITVQ